ncbi:MAG: cysteine--tRNA ligase [Pseudomonadales bacterium]
MLQVFNTLTRRKEEFVPLNGNKVNMYVCGITVYDYCHLGHARMLVAFDVIARWLRQRDYELTYARNITDIDDKILRRAAESGVPFRELTAKFIDVMHEDEARLSITPPDIEPRATEYIDEMRVLIKSLIDNGSAYAAENGDVYFSVKSFAGYGKLSGKKPDELLDGARIEIGELKRDPRDFALWKGANPDEPADAHFDAEWGRGRPGWHIECSAMATANLGDSFDIHGGGQDLVFPHHENEIAQAEAATHQHFAKYWLHNNAVRVDHEKMSKSLGNFFTIKEILDKYDAEVVRYFLVSSHYRTPINYSEDNLKNAQAALQRFYLALADVNATTGNANCPTGVEAWNKFQVAMDDDFGTPEALAVIFDVARRLNVAKQDGDADTASDLAAVVIRLGATLGLLQREPNELLQGASTSAEDTAGIESRVRARDEAKAAKDYQEADRIRAELESEGVILEDSREGTRWRKK